MEKQREFPTKKDLEIIFNKESGYYNFYSSFEDLICNVCGDIIPNDGSKEHFASEQDFVGEDLVTFCSKCIKLPNRKDLVKIYEKSDAPEENKEKVETSFKGIDIRKNYGGKPSNYATTGSVVVNSDDKTLVLEQPIDVGSHAPIGKPHLQTKMRASEQGKRPKKVYSDIIDEEDHKPLDI